MGRHLPEAFPCPICGHRPDVDKCGPETRDRPSRMVCRLLRFISD